MCRSAKILVTLLVGIPLSFSVTVMLVASQFPTSAPQVVPTYEVANYTACFEINKCSLYARLDITYNVISGNKTDGFKRFLAPVETSGYIVQKSIEVFDGNTTIAHSYRTFQGDDDNLYEEIAFTHPGFTGLRTITMTFIMGSWLWEESNTTTCELRNIGTFSIPVRYAEYQLIFPQNYSPTNFRVSCAGKLETNRTTADNRTSCHFTPADPSTKDITFWHSPTTPGGCPRNAPEEDQTSLSIAGMAVFLAMVGVCAYFAHKGSKGGSGGGEGFGGGCGGCGG
jgi:hypothetical protein